MSLSLYVLIMSPRPTLVRSFPVTQSVTQSCFAPRCFMFPGKSSHRRRLRRRAKTHPFLMSQSSLSKGYILISSFSRGISRLYLSLSSCHPRRRMGRCRPEFLTAPTAAAADTVKLTIAVRS
ncbi:hypothetical protein GGR52DRAFT_198438 [Hypoxylon sp. FL1284]|nr:hypothetical protein GGR52DRAFT_198438 [Hypoxylon sp. FL1284]